MDPNETISGQSVKQEDIITTIVPKTITEIDPNLVVNGHLIKEEVMITRTVPKDSLDRFGDDLSSLIVDYLSLEDRFRLECLSKQIQRVIYNSVDYIIINKQMMSQMKSTNIANKTYFDVKYVSQLIRKCLNVKRVKLETEDVKQIEDLLLAIDDMSKKWLRLKRIDINDNNFDVEIAMNLFETFGHLFTHLDVSCYYDPNFINGLITLCPNLSHLVIDSLSEVFTTQIIQSLANNLRKFEFKFTQEFTNEMFGTFMANMKTSLQCLTISDIPQESEHKESVIKLMSQLTEFTELRQLTLKFKIDLHINYSLTDAFTQIGVKLKKLKKLSIRLWLNSSVLYVQTMITVLSYRQIKSLDLNMTLIKTLITDDSNSDDEVDHEVVDWRSLDSLRTSGRLTHLTLNISLLTNKLLSKLVANSRKLLNLTLWYRELCNMNMVSLELISVLSNLNTLVITDNGDIKVSHSDVKSLFNKCVKLDYIFISVDGQCHGYSSQITDAYINIT